MLAKSKEIAKKYLENLIRQFRKFSEAFLNSRLRQILTKTLGIILRKIEDLRPFLRSTVNCRRDLIVIINNNNSFLTSSW